MLTKRNYNTFTFEDVINHLGQPNKIRGYMAYWQCPYCSLSGGDTHKDNLQMDLSRNILWCFPSNGEHSKIILSEISGTHRNIIYPISARSVKVHNEPTISLEYINACKKNLITNVKALTFINRHRGIIEETIDRLNIGIDYKKRRWVFPSYNMDYQLIGCEYRPPNLSSKGITKAKNTYSCICPVNKPESAELLYILEGFFDAYAFWQYLNENNLASNVQVATPSNGISSLTASINQIDFTKYKKVVLFVDNDTPANENLAKIEKIIKHEYEIKQVNCGCCKDFNDYYLKHIKNT